MTAHELVKRIQESIGGNKYAVGATEWAAVWGWDMAMEAAKEAKMADPRYESLEWAVISCRAVIKGHICSWASLVGPDALRLARGFHEDVGVLPLLRDAFEEVGDQKTAQEVGDLIALFSPFMKE